MLSLPLSLDFFFLQPYHNMLVSTNGKTISSVIYVGRVRVLTDRSNPWISWLPYIIVSATVRDLSLIEFSTVKFD